MNSFTASKLYFALCFFIRKPILTAVRSNATKTSIASRKNLPKMTMSSAFAVIWTRLFKMVPRVIISASSQVAILNNKQDSVSTCRNPFSAGKIFYICPSTFTHPFVIAISSSGMLNSSIACIIVS